MSATLVGAGESYFGSRLSVTVRLVLVLGERLCGCLNRAHECGRSCLSAVDPEKLLFVTLRAVVEVGGAYYTSGGRATLSRAFARKLSFFSFLLVRDETLLRLRHACLSPGREGTGVPATARSVSLIVRRSIPASWLVARRWLLRVGRVNSCQVRKVPTC